MNNPQSSANQVMADAELCVRAEMTKASLSSQEAAVKSVKQELTITQTKLQTETTQRSAMESQRLQWEAAIREAKVSLHQAASVLGTIIPEKPKEEPAAEDSEKGLKGKDKEIVKKEKV